MRILCLRLFQFLPVLSIHAFWIHQDAILKKNPFFFFYNDYVKSLALFNTYLSEDSTNEDRRHHYYDDREPDVAPLIARNPEWLDAATREILEFDHYPLGCLTPDDIEYITSLMIAWSRRWSVEAPTSVEALLKRVVDDLKAGNTNIAVSTTMYTAAIEAWGRSGADGRAERAQHIHDALVQGYWRTRNPALAPSVLSFNALINAWAKSGQADATSRAEIILQQMLACGINPDAVTIATILDTYSRTPPDPGQPVNVTRCEEIFDLADFWNISVTLYTFSTLQNVHARSGRPDGTQKALQILECMWDRYRKGDQLAKPSCINYNAVLNAASRNPTKENAILAETLLQRMEKPVSEGGDDVEPDRLSYALTILACSRCSEKFGVDVAEATLERMEIRASREEERRKELSSAAPPSVRLDVECFNVVLTALSRLNQIGIVDRIQEIIRRMERHVANGVSSVRPNVRTWNALLNGMARSSRTRGLDYSDAAESILFQMLEQHHAGVPNVLPNAFSFAAVMTTFQRSSNLTGVTERADRLLRTMEEYHQKKMLDCAPDVYHYTILCGVWAKSRLPGASDRCVQILSHMMERHRQGFQNVLPNVRTFNAVLDCFARSKQSDRAEQLLYHMLRLSRSGEKGAAPDAFSFNSVIHAFTQSYQDDAGQRAEAILERFLEYHEQEDATVMPDARSFTKIIAYYGRSRKSTGTGIINNDAPYRAEYVLNRMVALFKEGYQQLAPTAYAITTVMDGYSFAKHPDAGRNADRLLRLARDLEQNHGVRINIGRNIMNSVLYAWASCGDFDAGSHASNHLENMELEYKDGNLAIRPDSRSYSLVLSAWTTSVGPEKAKKVLGVIEAMKRQIQEGNTDVTLDEHHFALAINACAFSNANSEAENEAFRIAVQLFDEILNSDHLQATSLTYGWFIQCCGRLGVPDHIRNEQIERAFRLCCQDGLATDFVLRRLQGAAPEPLYTRLVGPVSNTSIDRRLRGKVQRPFLSSKWTRPSGTMRKE